MFKVKITNEDQSIIGEEKQLRIIVKPAPWNTWWARCAYALAIIGIAYDTYTQLAARKNRERNRLPCRTRKSTRAENE